jgi:hypothetical protein
MERSVLRAILARPCYLFKILFLQPKVHFALKTLIYQTGGSTEVFDGKICAASDPNSSLLPV